MSSFLLLKKMNEKDSSKDPKRERSDELASHTSSLHRCVVSFVAWGTPYLFTLRITYPSIQTLSSLFSTRINNLTICKVFLIDGSATTNQYRAIRLLQDVLHMFE
jgi:hypothetical protein